MKLESGHEVTPLEGAELERRRKDWKGYPNGLVRLTPGRCVLPTNYTRYANTIYNFKFRSSDVVIMTYPKCGTNWMQEIIWTMRHNSDFKHPLANTHMIARSPFMDFDMLLPVQKKGMPQPIPFIEETFNRLCAGKNPEDGVHLLLSEHMPDPRTIKSHLPFSLNAPDLLDTCKVVYVARNPKDVIVSYHHHNKTIPGIGYIGSFDDFVQYFVDDDLVYGAYWRHLKEAWERRNHPNLHIVFFEDLKSNTVGELKKLNTFLGTNLTDKNLEEIAHYTSFEEMKKRFANVSLQFMPKATNVQAPPKVEGKSDKKDGDTDEGKGYFRKGQVGDWKNKMSPELQAKVNNWIQKNMVEIGLNFKYDV